jgi:hypothetical protein
MERRVVRGVVMGPVGEAMMGAGLPGNIRSRGEKIERVRDGEVERERWHGRGRSGKCLRGVFGGADMDDGK